MPKIKTQDVKTGIPSISTPGVTPHSIASITVPKARPQTIFKGSGGQHLVAGAASLQHGLERIFFIHAKKEEELRAANSRLIAEDIDAHFLDRLDTMKNRTGENAYGLLNELKEDYGELKESSIPEDTDAKTRSELNLAFEKAYNRHVREVIGWQVSQAKVANNTVRKRNMNNSHKRINLLPVGDLDSVKKYAEDSSKIEIALNPNYNKKQRADVSTTYQEDYIVHAYTKWFTDNPTLAKQSWEDNQKILKDALPMKYSILANKYEQAKEDSKYDVLMGNMYIKHTNNYIAMIDDLEKNQEKYIKDGVHAENILKLISTFQTRHNFEVSENKRIKQENEDVFFNRIRQKYYDKNTGVFNNFGYIQDLEVAYRQGVISKSSFDTARHAALTGEFSIAQYHELMDEITDGLIITKGQINNRIYGTGAKPEPFYRELEKRKKAVNEGRKINYIKQAGLKYDRESTKKRTELDVKEKVLLLDPSQRPDFIRALVDRTNKLGYDPFDARVLDEANKMLQSGWYNYGKPEFHPGEAPWYVTGEKYTRKWEYDATLEQLKKEGEIEYIPGEIATSGNQEDKDIRAFIKANEKDFVGVDFDNPETAKKLREWWKKRNATK